LRHGTSTTPKSARRHRISASGPSISAGASKITRSYGAAPHRSALSSRVTKGPHGDAVRRGSVARGARCRIGLDRVFGERASGDHTVEPILVRALQHPRDRRISQVCNRPATRVARWRLSCARATREQGDARLGEGGGYQPTRGELPDKGDSRMMPIERTASENGDPGRSMTSLAIAAIPARGIFRRGTRPRHGSPVIASV